MKTSTFNPNLSDLLSGFITPHGSAPGVSTAKPFITLESIAKPVTRPGIFGGNSAALPSPWNDRELSQSGKLKTLVALLRNGV